MEFYVCVMCYTHITRVTGVLVGLVDTVVAVVASCLRVGIVHGGSVITKADPPEPR